MVDMTNDVIRFEEMFADRFTENDEAFMKLKSKKLPNPVVLYPWRTQRKCWNKRWDYGKRGRDQERGDDKNDNKRNAYNRHRDRDGGSNRDSYRDRSKDGRRDSYRDRSEDSRRDNYRDRSYDRRQHNYRDRPQDSRRDSHREDINKPFDFQAALNAYKNG